MVFLAQGLSLHEKVKETACIALESSRGGYPILETRILFINTHRDQEKTLYIYAEYPLLILLFK